MAFCTCQFMRWAVAGFALTTTAFAGGCGPSYMIHKDFKPAPAAEAGRATLLIIRTTSFGWGITIDEFLDGKMTGQTRGRCFFMTDVPLGSHYVIGDAENKAVARINFQAAKIYALSQGIYPGFWKARTGFSAMSAAEAKREMADSSCDYREYNAAKPGQDMEANDYKEAIDDFEKETKEDPDRHKDTFNYKGFDGL
ncbi:MAG: hypothetical protein EXR77_04195 [Myxococcales bacterium]|nr:hypothetical protein [Myxococcales bacterium]